MSDCVPLFSFLFELEFVDHPSRVSVTSPLNKADREVVPCENDALCRAFQEVRMRGAGEREKDLDLLSHKAIRVYHRASGSRGPLHTGLRLQGLE